MTSLQTLTALTRASFDHTVDHRRIILLAPRLRTRNALLAWFLQADTDVAFYALTPADTTLAVFLSSLVERLREV